jgi:type II secretory pathway pseudopilin PulG
MKRLCPRYELVFHRPLLLVGEQGTVFGGDLFPQFLEAGFHQVRCGLTVEIMDREFEEFAAEKPSFHRAGLGVGKESFAGFDFEDPQARLVSGQRDRHIQRLPSRPGDQFLGGIAPTQTERRLQDGLSGSLSRREQNDCGDPGPTAKATVHAPRFAGFRRNRKARSLRAGMVLLESMLALSILTVLGLVLLKLSLNILHPRQWVLQQTLSDAYMTYERSYAERIPFADLLANNSPWPAFPATSTTGLEIGRMPGNRPVFGTVTRTRIPDPGNYPIDGGTGTTTTNPAAMKVWKAQSILTYTIGKRTYAKSRTVLRSQ